MCGGFGLNIFKGLEDFVNKSRILSKNTTITLGGFVMAFAHSKGWYVSKLKEVGYIKHEGRKLESFRTYILRGLYVTHVGPITEK